MASGCSLVRSDDAHPALPAEELPGRGEQIRLLHGEALYPRVEDREKNPRPASPPPTDRVERHAYEFVILGGQLEVDGTRKEFGAHSFFPWSCPASERMKGYSKHLRSP